jgi:hypothetical protein
VCIKKGGAYEMNSGAHHQEGSLKKRGLEQLMLNVCVLKPSKIQLSQKIKRATIIYDQLYVLRKECRPLREIPKIIKFL